MPEWRRLLFEVLVAVSLLVSGAALGAILAHLADP
jgi:hypothetical protein